VTVEDAEPAFGQALNFEYENFLNSKGDWNHGLCDCGTMYRDQRYGVRGCLSGGLYSPKKDEAGYGEADQLFIDPVECIDCGACVPVCPVSAIYAGDDLPEKWAEFAAKNAAHFGR